jgi:L-threonylcarbamoyladenylate synthase
MMWYCDVTASASLAWEVEAADRLGKGNVLAFPTDTLYGLAVDPRSASAVSRLYRIKGRAVDEAVPLIAADVGQLDACRTPLTPIARMLIDHFWPGPLTLVVPAWNGLCPELLGGRDTVAVRVPNHAVARAIAGAFGHPITSTSANRSGQPGTADPAEVRRVLGAELDG